MKKLHISIEIETEDSRTGLNFDNFDKAILGLINEKEFYNFDERTEFRKKVKKAMRKRK